MAAQTVVNIVRRKYAATESPSARQRVPLEWKLPRPPYKTKLCTPDVRRVEPFRGFLHLEFHTLAIMQHLVPLEALDVVAVYEDVTAAFVREYEPVPFRGVEPLDLAFCHGSKFALCPDDMRPVRFR